MDAPMQEDPDVPLEDELMNDDVEMGNRALV